LNYITNTIQHFQNNNNINHHHHQQQQQQQNGSNFFENVNLNNFFNSKKGNKFSGNNNSNNNSSTMNNNSNNNICNSTNNNRINGSGNSTFTAEESDLNSRFISNILQKNKNQSHMNNINSQQQLHNMNNVSNNNNNGKSLLNNNNSNMTPLNSLIGNAASNVSSSSQMKISNIYNTFQQQNDAISSIDQLKISQNSNKMNNNSSSSIHGNGGKSKYPSDSVLFNESANVSSSNFGITSKNAIKNDFNKQIENNRNYSSSGGGVGSNYGFEPSSRNSSTILDSANSGNFYEPPTNLAKQSRLNGQANVQSALSGKFLNKLSSFH